MKRDPTPPLLWLILAGYLALAVAYGLVNPLFEAPDEHLHFFTAVWIAENNALPSVPQPATERFFVPETESDWLGQEAAQPPLYYLLASLVVRPFDTSHGREQTIFNPFVRLGDTNAPANRNGFVQAYNDWRGPEPAGHVWAAHLLRALSALVGLGTLLCIYASARLLWADAPERALVAVTLVAFLPQFTFQHSAISNDVLVTFLATAVLYQLLRLELSPQPTLRPLLLLGVTIGLTGLTKNQGTALLVYVLGFVLVRGWAGTRPWGDTLKKLVLIALPALALLAPLWWRNYQLYGDITAVNQFVAIAGGDRGYSLLQVLGETSGLWLSLFANFGWFNVPAPAWLYAVWTGLAVAGVAGLVWHMFREGKLGRELFVPSRHHFFFSVPFLLCGWAILVYASLLLFMMRTPAAQGRLLFPALLPLALGLAYGVTQFRPRIPFRWGGMALAGLLFALNLFCLTAVLPSAYAPPTLYALENSPPIAQPVGLLYPELGQLMGYELSQPSVTLDSAWPVTLWWEMHGRTPRPVTEFVQLVDEKGERVAGVDTFHGRGNFATPLWSAGYLFADEVWLEPNPAYQPDDCYATAVRLNVGLRSAEGDALTTAQGTETTTLGMVRLAPSGRGDNCGVEGVLDTAVDFANQIALVGATTEQTANQLDLTLTWQSLASHPQAQTVFVHLLDSEGDLVTAYDTPPTSSVDGAVYPTNLWQPGDIIVDQRALAIPPDLPAGRYQLLIGFYDPTDFRRLPITNAVYANEAFPIFSWSVTATE